MTSHGKAPQRSRAVGSLVLIAVVIGVGAAAFAYRAGWFSPQRLTPGKLVAAFAYVLVIYRCPLWVKSGNAHNEPMTSAFHPIANEQRTQFYVGSVPIPDSCSAAMDILFYHLVGAGEH
jgi:hypothetical protein